MSNILQQNQYKNKIMLCCTKLKAHIFWFPTRPNNHLLQITRGTLFSLYFIGRFTFIKSLYLLVPVFLFPIIFVLQRSVNHGQTNNPSRKYDHHWMEQRVPFCIQILIPPNTYKICGE